MSARLAADAVVVFHLLFIAFAVAGGALVLRWPRVAFVHLPAAAWAAYTEFSGTTCPPTTTDAVGVSRNPISGTSCTKVPLGLPGLRPAV